MYMLQRLRYSWMVFTFYGLLNGNNLVVLLKNSTIFIPLNHKIVNLLPLLNCPAFFICISLFVVLFVNGFIIFIDFQVIFIYFFVMVIIFYVHLEWFYSFFFFTFIFIFFIDVLIILFITIFIFFIVFLIDF